MASRKGRFGRRLVAVGLLLTFIGLTLVGCYPGNPQSTFDAAGVVAEKQRTLFYIIFWVAVVVFVVVESILIYAAIRFRRRPFQEIPKQTHGNTKLEIAWTIAPALVLIVIAVPTISTIFQTASPPPGDVMEVRVTAHQWWWEFEYPQLGVVAANELHVPVGRAINVTLQSDDVIHSFWVPKLAGKTDVVPNQVNTMWFNATRPGNYYGQCAELCGIAHAQMRFRVIAQEEPAFNNWVLSQKQPDVKPAAGSREADGARVFGIKGCAICHTSSSTDPERETRLQAARMNTFLKGQSQYPAPNLTHFAARGTLAAGLIDNNEDNLKRWLRDPGQVKPGNHMKALAGAYTDPKLTLTDEEIAALAAYLSSLQ